MTAGPSGLAGTAYAYRPCGRCQHTWIRHTFAPAPACADVRLRYDANPAGGTIPVYVKCSCPGWQETGAKDAGGQDTMTTPQPHEGSGIHGAVAGGSAELNTAIRAASHAVQQGLWAGAHQHYLDAAAVLDNLREAINDAIGHVNEARRAAAAGKDQT